MNTNEHRSRSALLVIDVQNDFLPGGSLAVADGDAVIPVINQLIESGAFDFVVATQDWHPADHGSFAENHEGLEPFEQIDLNGLEQTLWPVHCVQGTPGAEFANELKTGAFDAVFRKGTDPKIDSYSGFFDNGHRRSTGLGEWVRERGVDTVTITGLATDYCVKFTALDAVSEGIETTLQADACRGVNLKDGDVERAVEEMRSRGVRVSDAESETGPIHFYRTKDPFGEFSNFAGGFPFELKGSPWRTTEHYFQAQKFAGHPDEEELRRMPSPMAVARAGRSRKRPFRKDWESVKDQIMRDALCAKFTQHVELRRLLLGTGDRTLVEHTHNDRYWGDGGDGTGRNMLGQMLMELRAELRQLERKENAA